MSKALLNVLSLIGMLALVQSPLLAADTNTPLSEADLTLRPGDKIIWSPSGVHRLRFGGKVRTDTITLTSFADVKKILDIDPINPDFATVGDFVRAGAAQKVTATVKADAHTSGVSEFFFTCGVNSDHANDMVTVSFKIAAPQQGGNAQSRTAEIDAVDGPRRWRLKTTEGEKKLTRP
jgi:hypothetical protein